MANETRFGILKNVAPERASELASRAQANVRTHYALYQQLALPADAKQSAGQTPGGQRPTTVPTPAKT